MLNLRDDFPILRPDRDGKRLVYLDSAASSQKPVRVLDAVRNYYETSNANVHRGAYSLAVKATDAYENSRKRVAAFTGAYSEKGVVFTRGTSEAINLVASSWGEANVSGGDTVVVTALDHHSNLVPWQLLCERKGATLRMVEVTADGRIDMDDMREALSQSPKLVAFNWVSNSLGTVNPVAELVRLAHDAGAVVLVDGAQSAPHVKVDVQSFDIDFYAFSGHKMLAPMGIGALVARPELLDAMPPWQGGGEMIALVGDERSTFADLPHKFEAGTPNVGGAVGLAAAIDYLEAIGMDTVAEHEEALVQEAIGRISEIEGVRVHGPMTDRAGVLSFSMAEIHPHDLATIFDQEGVAIRAGHHCTQPLMRRLGVAATARASFYVYNDESDVDALIGAVHQARKIFGVDQVPA